jgi:hypothetical protein
MNIASTNPYLTPMAGGLGQMNTSVLRMGSAGSNISSGSLLSGTTPTDSFSGMSGMGGMSGIGGSGGIMGMLLQIIQMICSMMMMLLGSGSGGMVGGSSGGSGIPPDPTGGSGSGMPPDPTGGSGSGMPPDPTGGSGSGSPTMPGGTPTGAWGGLLPPPPADPDYGVTSGSADQGGASKYKGLINKYANAFKLDPTLVEAVIQQESDFQPNAVSGSGCLGLMQNNPTTAKTNGFTGTNQQLAYPAISIYYGCKELAHDFQLEGGDETKALMAYNGGPADVEANANPAAQNTSPRQYAQAVEAKQNNIKQGKIAW